MYATGAEFTMCWCLTQHIFASAFDCAAIMQSCMGLCDYVFCVKDTLTLQLNEFACFFLMAVYALAHAFDHLQLRGVALQNGTALKEAMQSINFQGLSGPIAFDSQLDPVASGLSDLTSLQLDNLYLNLNMSIS